METGVQTNSRRAARSLIARLKQRSKAYDSVRWRGGEFYAQLAADADLLAEAAKTIEQLL